MANLYGVANAPGYVQWVGTIGGANVSLPTGVTTPVFTSLPFVAPSAGYFFITCFIFFDFQSGATPPNGIFYAANIGAGSAPFNSSSSGPFAPSTTIQIAASAATVVSQSAWQGAGSTVTVAIQANTGPITINFGGSYAMMWMVRAPDQ